MSEVLKANIFFLITALAVICITIILAVVLIYLVRILKDLKVISRKLKEQTELLSEDVNVLRKKIKEKEWRWSDLLAYVSGWWNGRKGRKSKR